MLKSLCLLNFQSHKDTKLELSPGVNAIIGKSDSGKSSIIRAIRWVLSNRPAGDSFRSHWGGNTSILIELDDKTSMGHEVVVERIKTKKENTYQLNLSQFKAFKQGVPQEILDTLNINDINLQNQLDSHFLLGSSPSEVARILNEAVNLVDIDIASSYFHGETRRISAEINTSRQRKEDLKGELQGFSYLEDVETLLESLEKTDKKYSSAAKEALDLEMYIEDISTNHEEIKKYEDVEEDIEALKELEEKDGKLTKVFQTMTSLGSFIIDIEESKQILKTYRIDEKDELLMKELEEKNKALRDGNLRLSNIRKIYFSIIQTQKNLKEVEGVLKREEQELRELMPDICPLCEQPIK